jgi:N-acetylmuramoyl-L-alanine amidase
MKLYLIVPILFAVLSGCKVNPYRRTNKMYKDSAKVFARQISQPPLTSGVDSVPEAKYAVWTTNFNLRKPNFVIIHHTAQNSCPETLNTFTMERTKVSTHYVICRDGVVHHMLNDYLRAWQAGVSKWGNVTDVNSVSIGIELDNNGFEPFAPEQIHSLLRLLATLKKEYNIPTANFIGHSDIAPLRKVDPSYLFPWKELADSGYGLWYTDTAGVVVPAAFSSLTALRLIGFDIKDSSAAAQAFKRHWEQDTTKTWGPADIGVLYSLYRQYQ